MSRKWNTREHQALRPARKGQHSKRWAHNCRQTTLRELSRDSEPPNTPRENQSNKPTGSETMISRLEVLTSLGALIERRRDAVGTFCERAEIDQQLAERWIADVMNAEKYAAWTDGRNAVVTALSEWQRATSMLLSAVEDEQRDGSIACQGDHPAT